MRAPRLEAQHVGELALELAQAFVGLRVKAVEGLPPRDLLLVLQATGPGSAVRRLRLSADAEAARAHLERGGHAAHSGPLGPFFRRVEQELQGALLVRLTQLHGDRMLKFEFEETAAGRPRALLLELFGRRPNLVLLDEQQRVLELLVSFHPAAGESSARLEVGRSYAAPTAKAPPPAASPPEALQHRLAAALHEQHLAQPAPGAGPLSAALEALYTQLLAAREHGRGATDLRERLERRRARLLSARDGLARKRLAAAGAERLLQAGELLKANLGLLRRGLRSIELEDWFADPPSKRLIELDPKLRPQENVERCFERYHKLVRSAQALDFEERENAQALERLELLLTRLAKADSDPLALEAEALQARLLEPRQPPPRPRAAPAARIPYRSFQAHSGAEIRVGRSAAGNDALTFQHARGNDLWLHTAEAPGSHVVLVLAGRPEPAPEDLLDAAHLALQFSPLAGARRARIHWARRKQVHKPKGAKPGLVTLSGGQVLDLRVEDARLARLLGKQRERLEPGSAP